MYRRCLTCGAPFPPNGSVESLPLGARLAYDPRQGRLWQLCLRCRRWSLVPLEARWEALEELERLARDRGRTLSDTGRISLIRVGPLELVRVGPVSLQEESWWRFGREFRDRRLRAAALSSAGALGVGALAVGGWVTGGLALVAGWAAWNQKEWAADRLQDLSRRVRLGGTAWRGERTCAVCGTGVGILPFGRSDEVVLRSDPVRPGEVVLSVACRRCRDDTGGLELRAAEAERALERLLAYRNHRGAEPGTVEAAARRVEDAGSAPSFTRQVAEGEPSLGSIGPTAGVALEIALAGSRERRLMEMEAAELEAHWRREEELAEIIDGELTPIPLLRRLP